MRTSIDALSLILILGSAQSVFLALVFLRADRGKLKANRLLALFFLILPLATMNGILYRTGLYRTFPLLIGFEPVFKLLMGPLLYLYVESILNPLYRVRRGLPLHLGLSFILSLLCLPFILKDPVFKMLWVEVWIRNSLYTAGEYFSDFWYEILIQVQLWVYLGLVWSKLVRYEKMIRNTFSSIHAITLSWLHKVIIAFVCALLAGTFSYLLFIFVIKFGSMYLFTPLATVFSAYYISYKAFRDPDVFLLEKPPLLPDDPIPLAVAAAAPAEHRKYEKSGISEEESDLLLSRLEKIMHGKRPYTDSELTLPKLSAMLSTSHHHLSQLLNQRLGTNFYDYVNHYRIEDVKRFLSDSLRVDESILDIAFKCGFNSKSTFNKIFKTHTSLSPSQFRERERGAA